MGMDTRGRPKLPALNFLRLGIAGQRSAGFHSLLIFTAAYTRAVHTIRRGDDRTIMRITNGEGWCTNVKLT